MAKIKVLLNNQYGGFGLSLFAVKTGILESMSFVRLAEYARDSFDEDLGGGYCGSWNQVKDPDGWVWEPKQADQARFDEDLILLFERYGSEKISGPSCTLKLIEIEVPDPHEWVLERIVDHDGEEHWGG